MATTSNISSRIGVLLTAFVVACALAVCAPVAAHAADGSQLKAGNIASVSATAAAPERALAKTGANLKAAMKKYNVPEARVVVATKIGKLPAALSEASSKATKKKPCIVYMPKGNYKVGRINIPQNVIFVAEKGAKFTCNAASNSMVNVSGSLYGGTYDGAYKARNVIYFDKHKFSGKNGIVEKASVSRAVAQGILAMDPTCKNGQVIDCTATQCRENGICVLKGASYKLISGCNASNNTWSGINISHSNITAIKNCKILNNGDKGISTNSDPIAGYNQPGCAIGSMTGCTVSGNEVNGVYLKPKCTLGAFTGNTVTNNGDGLVVSAKTAAGTTGAAWVKNVANNTFKGNLRGQISSQDKGATIYMGAGNQVISGKESGIMGLNGGAIQILGANNVIKSNAKAGFSISEGSTLLIKGSGTKIEGNGTQGIYVRKGVVQLTGANTSVSFNGDSGIALYNASKLTITGKTLLKSNKLNGIYGTDRSVAYVRNVSYASNGKPATYVKNGASIR